MRRKVIKEFRDLSIQDDFMFCKVLQNMNICEKVLRLVLENENISIKKTTSQQTIENHSESKLVRLDVLAEDEMGGHFNIEMQMVNNDKIPKRMRFYQASIDAYMTEKGMPYANMPDTIIIFFCMFDAIAKGFSFYTFENICEEDKNIKLNDGTIKIIINVKAYEKVKNPELRGLLEYIYNGAIKTSLAEEINMRIGVIKQNKEFIKEYSSFYARMQDEREIGREEGIDIGREEGIDIGREEGIGIGRKEGLYAKAIETAKNCLDLHMSLETIAKITGLTQEEIAKLEFSNQKIEDLE